ncbi:MAG: glutamine--fructose-6-phosphate transaminase (isomerizing) [Simkaniaceae bacterium]
MCGIYGVVGEKSRESVQLCLEGLKNLEYRGYDSAGIAGISRGQILTCKEAGKIYSLLESVKIKNLQLDLAIAHTRWATHGIPTQSNAHPHMDGSETLAIVHNGIIENHLSIRDFLVKEGYVFQSETDSEVIAQLISYNYRNNLLEALAESLKIMKGSLAIAIIHKDYPDTIFAACRESPLVIGIASSGACYLSSDANAFIGKSLKIHFLKNNEIAVIQKNKIALFDEKGQSVPLEFQVLNIHNHNLSKNGFAHFMLKEIYEQPQTIHSTIQGRFIEDFGTAQFEEITIPISQLQSAERIIILGCGSSWHAGCLAATMLENIARIPTEAEIASEFRYTNPLITEDTLVIAISQSGETADTIAAVREAKAKGAKIIGICNVAHSTLAREADSCILLRAGPEISVCSTKAFTSQLTLLSLLTLHLARLRHMGKEEGKKFLDELKKLPGIISEVLSNINQIKEFAYQYSEFKQFFFLGRQYMYPASLEAALKLKEITYINATGYPGGEMKHGPLALIDENLALIGMCGNKKTYEKMLSNLMEVKARNGSILAFAPKGEKEILKITENVLFLPSDIIDELAAFPYVVAAQLFAYFIAQKRGCDIDQPRYLAKSVTVE